MTYSSSTSKHPLRTDQAEGWPADLLRDQSRRIEMIYLLGAVLWALNLVMDHYWAPQGDRGPYQSSIEVFGIVMASATAFYVRFSRARDDTKTDVGVFLMIPHALGLALLNSWAPLPTTARPLSPITVQILIFGMLAPARPVKMFVVGTIAASMDPLAVWVAHLRGLPTPSPINTILLFYPSYVCAVLSVVPARLLHRFGREVSKARALGNYELVERLGEGGMGEVWLARHRLLSRGAAIKLIRSNALGNRGADDAAATLRRFEREARATASLTSPHTVRVFDFGLTEEGRFYYVMELLNGCDLESLVRTHGPLPPARALYLVGQVCRSLSEAHQMGLVHRDIKPANVYVCRMGVEYDFVKVLDFGLVRQNQGPEAVTLSADTVLTGTPAYMAPETIKGQEPDGRVDIYAIGCLLSFLLTGELVFRSQNHIEQLIKHLNEPPRPPSESAAQPIPKVVDDLVLACLQKDPTRRPNNVDEVLRRTMLGLKCDGWTQEVARRWWETHLPDSCRWAESTGEPRVETGPPSAWLVPSWRH